MSVDWWRLHDLLNNLVMHYLMPHDLIVNHLLWCENVRSIDFLGTSCSAGSRAAPKSPADIDSTQSMVATFERATIDTTDETIILDFGPDMLCSVL